MGDNAKVSVKNNQYKVNGEFHRIIPNTPIYNEEGVLCGVTNPREVVHMHSYGGEAPFFEGIAKGILRGTRCDNKDCESNGSVYIPFRIHCPDCLSKMTVLDLTDKVKNTATVHTFMITERTGAFNTLQKPIKFINIEFEGVCTILMSYLVVGTPEMGMKVTPVFKKKAPTYTITDLAWVPAGTPESQLPDEFSY